MSAHQGVAQLTLLVLSLGQCSAQGTPAWAGGEAAPDCPHAVPSLLSLTLSPDCAHAVQLQ